LVDRTEIGVEDTLELTVVVSGGSGAVDTSAIVDFAVTNRGTSTSMRIVNTQVTREVRHRFALTPRRAGTLTIPALTVRSGKTTASTKPIAVRVVKRAARLGETRDIEVAAAVSIPSPYLGQELVFTFKLLSAVQIVRAGYDEPKFDGFAVTKLEDQRSYSSVRNGREYRVTEVSYLLVPQEAGTLTIGPGVVSCEVPSGRRRRSRQPFGSIFGGVDTVTKDLPSAPINVEVSPLPPYQGDGKFSGLVGAFTLSATLDPPSIPAGSSATLTLTLQGTGNVHEALTPELAVPPGTKIYPDDPEVSLTRDIKGTRGTKRFRFALVPTAPGQLSLPPLELVTFHPAQKRYVKLSAGLPTLTVEPSAEPETTAALTPPAGLTQGSGVLRLKKKVEKTGHDILSVRRELDALTTREEMGLLAFSLWLLGPALACGALGVTAKRMRRAPSPTEQMARRAQDLLVLARNPKSATDIGETLALLYRALASAVLARAGRAGESLTYDEARDVLSASGVPETIIEQVVALLRRIDSARYGGLTGDDAGPEALREETSRAVRDLLKGKNA
jgi:hypothetical protein